MDNEHAVVRRSGSALPWQVLSFVYAVVMAGYLLYSSNTGTGLIGWLEILSQRWFNYILPDKALAMVALIVLMIPLLLLYKLFVRNETGDAPELTNALPAASNPYATSGAIDKRPPLRSMTLGAGFVLMLLPWVVGYPLFHWYAAQAKAEAGTVPQLLVLPDKQVAPEAPGKFVELRAVAQTDVMFYLTKTRNGVEQDTDYYVPLTAADWTPAQAVRYVLHLNRYGEAKQGDLTAPFYLEVTHAVIPELITTELQKAGVTFATPMYVVEPVPMQAGGVADRTGLYELYFYILGAISSALGLLLAVMGFFLKRSQQHRTSRQRDI